MAAPQALREITEFEHVLKANRSDPPEEQVKFTLTGLDGRDRAQVRQLLLQIGVGDNPDLAKAFESSETAVALGLKGWTDNMKRKDKNGELVPVPWPGKGRMAVKRLHDDVIQELAMEILAASELTDDERGN